MGLKVTIHPTVEPVSVELAKLHARVEISDDDALIASYIKAARERAEHETERALAPAEFCSYLDEFPDGGIKIPRPPINAVSSVQYVDASGVLQTIDSADYALDDAQEPAWLLPAYGYTWPTTLDVANAVRVTFTAGYTADACPAQVKSYILAVVAAMYAQREILAQADRVPKSVQFLDGLLDAYRVRGV